MKKNTVFFGVDVSEGTFTVSAFRTLPQFLVVGKDYKQDKDGFSEFLKDIRAIQQTEETSCVCMETTGFYGEKLCQYLYAKKHIDVHVEPAQHVKRAFRLKGKTDKADSKQITEYAYRYFDQLTPWTPPPQAVEDLRALATSRIMFKRDEIAHRNRLTSYSHLTRQMHTAALHKDVIDLSRQCKKQAEKEMKEVLNSDPEIAFHAQNLNTIKCIGLHCIAGFCLVTHGFRRHDTLKLAGLLGLAPRPDKSGTSVKGKDETDHHGYRYLSTNLHLAAKSACNHVEHFREYYARLRARGKHPLKIYNNVSYKLLKRMCVVIRERRPYHDDPPLPKFFQQKGS